jgi:hypothetical protein
MTLSTTDADTKAGRTVDAGDLRPTGIGGAGGIPGSNADSNSRKEA